MATTNKTKFCAKFRELIFKHSWSFTHVSPDGLGFWFACPVRVPSTYTDHVCKYIGGFFSYQQQQLAREFGSLFNIIWPRIYLSVVAGRQRCRRRQSQQSHLSKLSFDDHHHRCRFAFEDNDNAKHWSLPAATLPYNVVFKWQPQSKVPHTTP